MKRIIAMTIICIMMCSSVLSVYANESKTDAEEMSVTSEQNIQNNEVSEEEDEEIPEDYIDVTSDGAGEMSDEQAERMDKFVEEYGKELNFSEDGIDTSDVNTEKLEDKYGEEVVEMMDAGIEAINEKVEEDEYAVTDNGTIYETDDEDMTVQGKYNKTSGTTYYWGRLIKESYSRANKHKKSLKTCNSANSVLASVTTAAGLFKRHPAFTFDTILSMGIDHYTSYFCKRITACNKKNIGIKYKIYWAPVYRMRTQNKSF